MEALAAAAAAAAAAVAAERVVYRTTHAVPLAHARKLHTYASMHTAERQKQEQHDDHWQHQTGPTAVVVVAARSSGGSAAAGAASYERASLLSSV